ncbi:MAG: O-antigen ligase family protein [Caulobacteraceae bacterium]
MITPKAGQAPDNRVQPSDVFIDLRRQRVHGGGVSQARDAAFEMVQPGRRRRKPIWIDLNALPLDGAYAFILFCAMLFVQQAGSLSGLVMAVLPLIYLVIRRRQAGEIFRTRWILLAVPAFGLLSVLWSEAPGVTAKYGIEMWLTAAAGIGLSAALRPTAVLKGACLAFAVYMFVSLALGHTTMMAETGGGAAEAFTGLGDGKNLLADIASTGVLISITTVLVGLRQRKPMWTALALCALAADVRVIMMARSAGATLAVSGAAAALLLLALLSLMPRPGRIGAIVLTFASVGIFAAAFRDIGAFLISLGAQVFDKDATLTGRTYLWYRANDLIAEKPWFGRGLYAFWRQGNTDAEGLWQYAGILGRSGFNFHNTLVELTVQLGLIGAAVFVLVGLVGLVGLVRHFVQRPSLMSCFWLAYMLYVIVRAPVEAVGYAPFYFSTCLLFAAAGAGLQRLPRRAVLRPRHQSQAVRLKPYYAAQQTRAEVMAGAP